VTRERLASPAPGLRPAPRRLLAARGSAWAAALALAAAPACIIPDRDIRAESDDENPGAVRIIEAIPVVQELRDACEAPPGDPTRDRRGCPQVPSALSQGLIAGGPFCTCAGGDANVLPEFVLYAEDPDRRRDGPADTLYAVALLDLDPETTAPQNFVAYPEHLTPGGAGEYLSPAARARDIDEKIEPSVGREDNGLWRFRFGKDGGRGVDLCNDDNGQKVPFGLHNLQIMVTDRPFFRPPRLDAEGNPVRDGAGRPVLLPPQHGMPDLGIGATWAVANYVFECKDPSVAIDCVCAEEGP
jgi:hypothetical protein